MKLYISIKITNEVKKESVFMDEREKMCRALILEIRKGSNKDVKLKKEVTRAFEKGILSECSKKEYKK